MTPYQQGYERGYLRERPYRRGDKPDGDVVVEARQAAEKAAVGLSDQDLGNWSLGFFDGSYHGRTGCPPHEGCDGP